MALSVKIAFVNDGIYEYASERPKRSAVRNEINGFLRERWLPLAGCLRSACVME